jgi:hypothetical protein
MSRKELEIFHIAADGTNHEVALVVAVSGDEGCLEAEVVSYVSSKSECHAIFDPIEGLIDGYQSEARKSGGDVDVHRIGVNCEFIRKTLILPLDTPIRCKELVRFFIKRYKIKLNF